MPRVEQLGIFLKFEGVLPRPAYQFIVLSVARATGAGFEWRDHVKHALAAGLPREVIDAIASRADKTSDTSKALPHPFVLLNDILAKTMAWQEIPDELQARAAAEWGREGLVEIVVVSGFYQMSATINQGFGIRAASTSNR